MMKKNTFIIASLFLLMSSELLFAQASLREISLQQQIEQSSLIVEGKVVSQNSFWDIESRNIYTSNTIEVFKVFKGEKVEYIEVITLGGVVGLTAQISSHSLQLSNYKQGVFMLNPTNKNSLKNEGGIVKYETYSGVQGFYKYDLASNAALNVFKSYNDIEKSFYNKIKALSKQKMSEVKTKVFSFSKGQKSISSKSGLAVAITNISPTSIIAGEKSQLTITGSGFGAVKGTVGFRDANDGKSTGPFTYFNALDSEVTWSDTSIVVEVPSRAGTGAVRVNHASDATTADSAVLTVTHAEINVITGGNSYQVQHVNDNGSGGYEWEMFTDFFNDSEHSGAKAAFETALDNWRCETKVNWTISTSATVVDVVGVDSDVPPDGIIDPDGTNVVRFDNGNELEAGVLGRCTSWYSGCSTGSTPDINWFVSELDIVFDDGTNWYFGTGLPGFTQYDFHSVALHELGHGHQLGHVIDPTFDGDNLDDVMHYAISNSEQQRVLSTGNIAGGNSVHDRSTTLVPCAGTSVMIDSTICNLSIEDNELQVAISIYPNPAKGQFFINNASAINLEKAVIYDISGRLISEYDITNASRTKTINVANVSKGVYFVNIHSDNAMVTKRVILD